MSLVNSLNVDLVSVSGNRATWHVTGLLLNRIHPICRSDTEVAAEHEKQITVTVGAALAQILLKNWEEVEQNKLKEDRWGEAAHGIHLEEAEAGDWGQNVFPPHSHQMSAEWRCHQLLWGQFMSRVNYSISSLFIPVINKIRLIMVIIDYQSVSIM